MSAAEDEIRAVRAEMRHKLVTEAVPLALQALHDLARNADPRTRADVAKFLLKHKSTTQDVLAAGEVRSRAGVRRRAGSVAQ